MPRIQSIFTRAVSTQHGRADAGKGGPNFRRERIVTSERVESARPSWPHELSNEQIGKCREEKNWGRMGRSKSGKRWFQIGSKERKREFRRVQEKMGKKWGDLQGDGRCINLRPTKFGGGPPPWELLGLDFVSLSPISTICFSLIFLRVPGSVSGSSGANPGAWT